MRDFYLEKHYDPFYLSKKRSELGLPHLNSNRTVIRPQNLIVMHHFSDLI